MNSLEDVGRRLRVARSEMRMDQLAFAELGGVKKNSQINYEAGRTPPNAEYLLQLERHGVDVAYVLTGKLTNRSANAEQALIFETLSKLSARERRAILALASALRGDEVDTYTFIEQMQQQAARGGLSLADPQSLDNTRLRAIAGDQSLSPEIRAQAEALLSDPPSSTLQDKQMHYRPKS